MTGNASIRTALNRPARVEAQGWAWRHGSRASRAVAGVDFVIEPGERVLLLGPSGSGKSTILHGLAGVLGGDEEGEAAGRLLIDGADASAARGRSGLVLQDPDAQLVMARLADDVAFGLENLGVPRAEIGPRVREALAAVGLDLPLDRSTAALSGGQRQRLALAGVIAMRPGVLLLDEPTANLDPEGVIEVRDAVARVVQETGATLIVVEHRVPVWLPVVDRVIVLGRDGRLIADGPADRVLEAQATELRAAGVWLPGDQASAARRPNPSESGPFQPGRSDHGQPDHRVTTDVRPSLLTASGLAVARQTGRPVQTGLDFAVREASVLAVTGPNGAGKSTLALTLAGLLRPEHGSLEASARLADGAAKEPWRWKSRQLLTRIGTVFQNPEHQFLAGTVRAELEVGPRALRLRSGDVRDRVEPLLEALRLTALAGANPFTLSGGEKRRLSVATALATRPSMLVLDEPTFGQDAVTWRELVRLIGELRDRGAGVVAVTHDETFVDALADARFALGPPAEVATEVPV
ncbi:ABC transporter ATP-binding protein [Agromyces aerolatus]|uniref:ABC transporter ATP-binding protein n=1 Tax=Agromyces sp. LY-1074 TaxID=3074080 RepID=UPI00285EAC66|nr:MULTISPECIES: ATP-binding cassette domain-containing protein [unclassified Agromyces]MDR5699903.1 ATP-binding cassette domain-containing protein [Agromyces sp. LY-1074]MDR5706285.1 ATP-binding cassette domain-containing protein [Agromyces sp. LY-1358]